MMEIAMALFLRRKFLTAMGVLGFSAFVPVPFLGKGSAVMAVDSVDSFEQARYAFARAIAYKRDGKHDEAGKSARACLELIKDRETMEETAAGAVVVIGSHCICEPSFLHVDAALQRFRFEKIL